MGKYKKAATKEQKEIIDMFFSGMSQKTIARHLSDTRTVQSDKTKKHIKMPLSTTMEIVQNALLQIDWGGKNFRKGAIP